MGFQESGKINAIERTEINFKGEFNFEAFYKLMYNWLEFKKFKSMEGDQNIETWFFENIWSGGKAKEMWFYWRTKKHEPDFYTYYISIDCHNLGMTKEEKIIDGKKISTNNLELDIFFSAWVEYTDKGEKGQDLDIRKHWFTRMFQDKFFGEIHKKQIEDKKVDLYNQVQQLINLCKQNLGLLQHIPQPKPFITDPYGVPTLR